MSAIHDLIASGDRVTPIFRKTGTIMLGADAFTRAEDIERAIYRELPRLVQALKRYGRHHGTCEVMQAPPIGQRLENPRCTCGLWDAYEGKT